MAENVGILGRDKMGKMNYIFGIFPSNLMIKKSQKSMDIFWGRWENVDRANTHT